MKTIFSTSALLLTVCGLLGEIAKADHRHTLFDRHLCSIVRSDRIHGRFHCETPSNFRGCFRWLLQVA